MTDSPPQSQPQPSSPPDNTLQSTLSEANSDQSTLTPLDSQSEPSDAGPLTSGPPDQTTGEAWEDGENNFTLLLRALFTILAGWFLAWSQQRSTIDSHTQWNSWILLSVLANFAIPLFIVWMFFGQSLFYLEWLRDQKFNAWNYGWKWDTFRRQVLISLGLFVLMLPILYFASRDEGTRTYYLGYFPPHETAMQWLWLLVTITIYMFCWEWFFRGFLLFGVAQGLGAVVAIAIQAIVFGLMHGGKPGPEMYSSFAGGLILGVIAWREKSFVSAFLTHTFIHIAWALLVLL